MIGPRGTTTVGSAAVTSLCDDRARWLVRHALPCEPALRVWLSSRRLPGVEIDDVIQETYARLIRAESLAEVRNPKAYMFQTAWSVIVTNMRRERIISMQALAELDEMALTADQPSPEQEAADRQELLRLAEAIGTLPGKVRDVFKLRRVDGLSQKEVARRLGLSESTVEKHMRRGLLLLLKRFAHGGLPEPKASRLTDSRQDVGLGHDSRDRKADR